MVAIKALYDEYNQLSREAKGFQDQYQGDQVAPRDDLNAMLARAERMDAIKAELETAAEQKALSSRVQAHMDWNTKGTGHVPLTTGPNPDALEDETKEDWIIAEHKGTKIPLFHKSYLQSRPDILTSTKPEYKRVYEKYLRGDERYLTSAERELLLQGKALSEGSNVDGGFAVPVDFIPEVIRRLPGESIFQDRARHITTNRDQVLAPRIAANTGTYPTMYSSAVVFTWVPENPTAAAGLVAPKFENLAITVNTAKLETILSRNLVADAAFSITGFLSEEFRIAANLGKDAGFLVGTGLGQPTGVFTDAGVTAVTSTGAAGVIGADDPKELRYKLAVQYEAGAMFWMSRDCLRKLRELKDGNGNYIWSPGFNHGMDGGAPDMIEGLPYACSDFIDSVATAKHPMAIGNPKYYWVVDRLDMSIQVLDQLYAESNQVAYLGFLRVGGAVTLPQAWRTLLIN